MEADSRRTNHSCNPNVALSEGIMNGHHVKIALRKIEPGEEICWNYFDITTRGAAALAFQTEGEREEFLAGEHAIAGERG